MNLVLVLGICIIATMVSVLLKGYGGEYSLIISLLASAIILIMLITSVYDNLLDIRNAVSKYSASSFFLLALKSLGICVITGFVADSCRQAGQISLASKAELAGRCAIFILSVPLLSELIDTAYGFIK
ncbi:MAG: stage III sporulation AC/AD family protein [Clostridia bacterium]|nr:stage III sporulation AC/AD family protein [Clostridia bacterium]